MRAAEKPLFIPLKAEYFDAFRDGAKTAEYRPYGPRWNERVCTPGRRVVLSRGYGIKDRLQGTIATFLLLPVDALAPSGAAAFRECYPDADGSLMVAVVQINVSAHIQIEIDKRTS